MRYHPIKFGCNKISNSEEMVEILISDFICPDCDCDPEDGKPIFLQVTLAHDDASPYKV